MTPVDVAILGGSGYVAGELLRILGFHPVLRVKSIVSTTQAGEPVVDAFGHLQGTHVDSLRFSTFESLLQDLGPGAPLAVFTATPHGSTAPIVHAVLSQAEKVRARVHLVDLSADFRFPDATRYEAIYGQPHGAPERLEDFTCAVPEQYKGKPPCHAVQPGCFTTAVTLAAHPFFARDLVHDSVFVSAVTGSSGSGRTPKSGTHHPARRSNLVAYAPLAHRHEAEMRDLLALARGSGTKPDVAFVPHSGPQVRGIHATLHMTLRQDASVERLLEVVREVYAGCPFVTANDSMPSLTDVIGTNACRLGVAVRGRDLVVTSVIDNLVKGAAGGAVQWMNRLLDLPDDTGLRLPGLGWF